jgi:hypothetical protein
MYILGDSANEADAHQDNDAQFDRHAALFK